MHDLVAASAGGIRRSLETLWFGQYRGRWRSRGRPGPHGVETHVSRARALRVLSG